MSLSEDRRIEILNFTRPLKAILWRVGFSDWPWRSETLYLAPTFTSAALLLLLHTSRVASGGITRQEQGCFAGMLLTGAVPMVAGPLVDQGRAPKVCVIL